ncbi:hypothetical protein J6590_023638 [Homalodisca vitripennis]|nr:hypothetical protein J6590_023638 [Homalodisca vitripennis]
MFISPYAKGWAALLDQSKKDVRLMLGMLTGYGPLWRHLMRWALAKLTNVDSAEKRRNQRSIFGSIPKFCKDSWEYISSAPRTLQKQEPSNLRLKKITNCLQTWCGQCCWPFEHKVVREVPFKLIDIRATNKQQYLQLSLVT